MTSFVLIGFMASALLAVAGLYILVRQSRTRASFPLPLSAFPLAMLMLAAPVLLSAIHTVRAFATIGEGGRASLNDGAALAMGIVRPVWIGCFAFLIVLGAAHVIEWFTSNPGDESDGAAPQATPWAPWITGLSALPFVPVAVLAYYAKGTASLLMQAISALASEAPQTTIAGMPIEDYSVMMSTRLVLSTLGGGSVTAVAIGCAGLCIVAHRFGSRSIAIDRLSRAIAIVAGLVGIGLLIMLTIDIRAIAQTAARATTAG